MTQQPFTYKCPRCSNVYDTEDSLKGHLTANHWKLEYRNKRGKA
ncbi:MAG: C2H2-type zinc finger protein [Candidatus Babeliales bacterium]